MGTDKNCDDTHFSQACLVRSLWLHVSNVAIEVAELLHGGVKSHDPPGSMILWGPIWRHPNTSEEEPVGKSSTYILYLIQNQIIAIYDFFFHNIIVNFWSACINCLPYDGLQSNNFYEFKNIFHFRSHKCLDFIFLIFHIAIMTIH